LERAGVRVEQVGLGRFVQERVMLVLPVHRDQAASELPELPRSGGATVQASAGALSELSLQDELRSSGVEDRGHGGAVGAMPHLVGRTSRAERQAQGVDDERLAAAGLAGEQVEARAETDASLGDEREVANAQLTQHYLRGTRGRPQPSFSPRRR